MSVSGMVSASALTTAKSEPASWIIHRENELKEHYHQVVWDAPPEVLTPES
jgi:hypothetical protein